MKVYVVDFMDSAEKDTVEPDIATLNLSCYYDNREEAEEEIEDLNVSGRIWEIDMTTVQSWFIKKGD